MSKVQGPKPEFRSYEQVRDEILGRYSVSDLVEQTDEDLRRGDEMFYKSQAELTVHAKGTFGAINEWILFSDGRERQYTVRRFKNFVWCSCRDFFFRKKVCKHIARTAGVLCDRCYQLRATVGKYCHECDHIMHPFGTVNS